MRQDVLVTWLLLALLNFGFSVLQGDSEDPPASAWLDGDWSAENVEPEQIAHDTESGCICRFKLYIDAVCYGSRQCTSFPRNVGEMPWNVTVLHVKTTAFTEIRRHDLENLRGLETLEIDANYQLQRIAPGVFIGMLNLRILSISYNSELKALHPNVFVGLTNLEELRLVKNGFQNVLDATQALQAHYLPKLTSLSLNENSFSTIGQDAFNYLNGSNIVQLDLVLCQIENLHPKALNVFKTLQMLRLGDNLMREDTLMLLIDELIKEQVPISLLNLYNSGFRRNNKLTELLDKISHLNVTHLVLARNHIENIATGFFPEMPTLKFLDLREVSAVTLEVGALRLELLPKLEVLLLGGNKLSGVLPGVQLPQLKTLDLTDNSGGSKFPSYFDVISNCLSGMTDLQELDLSFNRISSISTSTFNNLEKLRVLGLKNATVFYISPRAFTMLSELEVLNLESNPFQPFNTFQSPIFEGLVKLENLLLANCKILSFQHQDPFKGLTNLKYLDLSGNELSVLDSRLFLPLSALIGIDLTNNRLQPWTKGSLFQYNTDLRIVKMAGNRLTSVSAAMMSDIINTTRLDISQNAFVCDCWTMNLTMSWLETRHILANETVLMSPGHVCSTPDAWRDKPLATFLEVTTPGCIKVSRISEELTTSVYIFMAVVVATSLLLGVLAYIYRWHIRYWAFLARISFLRRHSWLLKKNKVSPSDYKYDVFVSYSHEDRNFIVRLVSMLENHEPYLKLCVYERDFEIGTVISDTVMEKVSMSRRTLLVVSNAFAKSQWCMWELQLAEYHRLFFRRAVKESIRDDPLIMVKLGPIAECNITPTLKFLLKSRIYLEWNHDPKKQTVFWERLRSTLHQGKVSDTGLAIISEGK